MEARALAGSLVFVLVLFASAPSRAQQPPAQQPPAQQPPSMNGMWRAGATAINVAVESWGKDCGPEPKSSQSSGGGVVRIDQNGNRLSLHGSGRVVNSDACFGQNPNLKRTSTGFKDSAWTTRCETPKTDPRAEAGIYSLKLLSPDRLLYQDISRFRWELKTSLCVATITTVQTLSREGSSPTAPKLPDLPNTLETGKPAAKLTKAQQAAALKQAAAQQAAAQQQASAQTATPVTPVNAAATTTAKVEPPPCVPGEAKRLVIAPRQTTIELGGRVCFRPRLLDAAGCRLPPPTPTWSLEHGPALRGKLDERGCFEASSQAAEGEGAFTVTATLGALHAESAIQVVAADLSALVAKRLFEADAGEPDEAAAALESPTAPTTAATGPVTPPAASRTATRAVGAASAQEATPSWIWAVALVVIGIFGGAIVLALRRRAADVADSMAPSPIAAPQVPASSKSSVDAGATDSTLPAMLRCPKCGTEYPPGSAFCGTDGSPLT